MLKYYISLLLKTEGNFKLLELKILKEDSLWNTSRKEKILLNFLRHVEENYRHQRFESSVRKQRY